ncbi:MAG: GIY-YIG nuclease family protein [Alphaproteobacteria bacterium]|nr:GIY-YIG nuclease family protein [Alphaproteobacteria bacterium]
MKNMYVYIITNKPKGTLYIGVTNNLQRRIYEHKNKLVEGFSSRYNLDKLVYFECFDNEEYAIKREKRIKKYNRNWKITLIESLNPNWIDLYEDICR